jgi:GH43 family beta-xylosidase
MKKISVFILAAVMLMTLASCDKWALTEVEYPFYNEIGKINNNLFYQNDLTLAAADPGCIYITEGEDAGYFYLYPTTDAMYTRGVMAWRSKNLNDWEPIGVVYEPVEGSWGEKNIWAPEVIYNEVDGKYYMYFSMTDESWKNGELAPKLCVAVSDSPRGPFVQWTGVNADGVEIGLQTPFADFSANIPYSGLWSAIDAHPFFDTNGDFYLYFNASRENADGSMIVGSSIYGVKMKDMVTPDYSTVVQLTRAGSTVVDEYIPCDYEGSTTINEAPFVLEHEGKYYLTYSMNGYTDPNYSVCQAVADSPLGPYTKIEGKIANPILGRDPYFDYVAGTGHHSFVTAGDEMFIVYHAHLGRGLTDSTDRGIAFDRCHFMYDETLGYDVLYVNGPTYSPTPLPAVYSGYKNVADQADVSVSKLVSGSADMINDNRVVYHDYDRDQEVLFADDAKITLSFDEPQTVSSVLIYNSINISYAFGQIDCIELYPTVKNDVLNEATDIPAEKLVLTMKDISIAPSSIIADLFVKPGAATIAEFQPVEVSKIVIYISQHQETTSTEPIGVSEVVVLGTTGN